MTSNIINANSAGLVRYNGTGIFDAATTTDHNVLLGAPSNGITNLAPGSAGTVLASNGTGADPSFQSIPGVGVTVTNHYALVGGASNSITSVNPSTAGLVLASNGPGNDPSFQAVPGVGTTVTQYTTLVGGASNSIVGVGPGTSGYVLTSNGSGANPSFQPAIGGSAVQTLTDGSLNVVSPTAGNIRFVNGNNISNISGSSSQITFNLTGTTQYAVQVGNSNGSLTSLGLGSTGQALVSGGSFANPAFGILPVVGGGSGANILSGILTGNGTSAFTASPVNQYGVVIGDSANKVLTAAPGAAGTVLASNGVSANPSFQSVPGVGVTVTNHAALVGGTANSITSVGPGAAGTVLAGNGASANPSFQTIPGLGVTLTQYTTLVGGASNSIVGVGPGTAGQVLTSNGAGANPSFQPITSAVVSTLSDDVGTSITPSVGNIQLVGHINEQGSTKFSTVVAGSSLANINPMSPARWIVDPLGFNGTHTTISSAITSATAGDTILILTGTYTENITLKAGVNLCGMGGDQLNPNVLIVGNIGASFAGTASLANISVQTNSNFCLSVTGSNATVLNLNNCIFLATNNTAIQYSSSSSSSTILMYSCGVFVQSTGISVFSHSSAGSFSVWYSFFSNPGGSTTASAISSTGSITLRWCNCFSPLTFSSSSTGTFQNCNMDTSAVNTIAITLSGTSTGSINSSRISSGSAACLSIGSGCSFSPVNNRINSSATNVFTGAGTVRTGANVCINSSGNNVSTIVNLTVI